MTTPTQQRVFDFIQTHLDREGYSPSLSEIARGIGLSPKSVSLISRCIKALTAAGKLTQESGSGYRRVQLTPSSSFELPITGRIAAGSPIEALEDKKTINLQPLFQNPSHFILQVTGDSMIDDGILDGDLVICRQSSQANEGDIVVALIDGREATLKRISFKLANHITLIPANPTLKPKAYSTHRITLQGIYRGLVRVADPPG